LSPCRTAPRPDSTWIPGRPTAPRPDPSSGTSYEDFPRLELKLFTHPARGKRDERVLIDHAIHSGFVPHDGRATGYGPAQGRRDVRGDRAADRFRAGHLAELHKARRERHADVVARLQGRPRGGRDRDLIRPL